jgi:hypothetical protein
MSNVLDFMIPVKFKTEEITATAGQTVFTLSTITIPSGDVERCFITINGSKQAATSFTVDSTTQFTLDEGAELNDLVEVTVPSYK